MTDFITSVTVENGYFIAEYAEDGGYFVTELIIE